MRRGIRSLLAAALFATALPLPLGCARPRATYIGVDGVALGRVVIYRNGVAYYERQAKVEGNKLVVRVPRERVDDFLKSLKVTDVGTGETVAVTIPRDKSASDGDLMMVLRLPADPKGKSGGVRLVNMTYVTEAPAWKPSYRVVVGAAGNVELEAWAIIDNTSGEDWNNVLVSVGASSAMSFRYDLWRVRTVDRDLLASDERLAVAPPMGATPYGDGDGDAIEIKAKAPSIDVTTTNQGLKITKEIIAQLPVPGRSFEGAAMQAAGTSGDGVGVAVSGSSSLENNYIVEGINTTSLSLGNYYGYRGAEVSRARDPRMGGVEGVVAGAHGPLAGVRVEVTGGGLRGPLVMKADSKGRFHADGLTAGTYEVKVMDKGAVANVRGIEVRPGQVASIAPSVAAAASARDAAAMRQLSRWAELVPAWRQRNATLEVRCNAPTESEAAQLAAQTQAQLRAVGVAAANIRVRTVIDSDSTGEVTVAEVAAGAGDDEAPGEAVIGDSHFTSPHPMTVAAGSSAMVAMLRGNTVGGEVYLYDPLSARGNAQYAFRAVRLQNPSTSALEPGPVTVYGDGRFIGEGITDAVAAGATTVVPFALDRQVIVRSRLSERNAIQKLISVDRDGLWAELEQQRVTKFAVTNRGAVEMKVLLRHQVANGYTLTKAPGSELALGDSRLFEISVAAGQTKKVEVVESTPKAEFFALSSNQALQHLRELAATPTINEGVRKAIADVLATNGKLAALDQKIAGLRVQADEYQARGDELNVQLVSLRAVKTTGELMQKLQQRMAEISDRKQKTTIAIVEAQQQTMLLRLRLQDAYGGLRDAAANLKLNAAEVTAVGAAP